MRSVANTNAIHKRRKRKRVSGDAKEKRQLLSKAKDPLHSFKADDEDDNKNDNMVQDEYGTEDIFSSTHDNNDHDDDDDNVETEDISKRVFSNKETIGKSTSGRQQWKLKHRKGKFNPKNNKRNPLRVPGTFASVKRKYK